MDIVGHKPPKTSRRYASVQAQVAENVHRAGWYVQSLMVEFFKKQGLTPQQYNCLHILKDAPDDGLPSLEIGRRMVQKLPDITRLIDRIEKAGWVVRERSTEDRRVVRVVLTPEGRTLVERLEDPINDFCGQYLDHMTEEELVQLNGLLEKMYGLEVMEANTL